MGESANFPAYVPGLIDPALLLKEPSNQLLQDNNKFVGGGGV